MSNLGILLRYEDEDGFEIEEYLKSKYEVCSRCRGEGKHTNPNIDGHGISSDEWENDWSDEDKEFYLSGGYDIECYECKGLRVVQVIDDEFYERSTGEDKILYEKYLECLKDEEDYQRICEGERKAGC